MKIVKSILVTCSIFVLAACSGANNLHGRSPAKQGEEFFTFPAEFDKQEAVWMVARPFDSERPTIGIAIQMIKALTPTVKVRLMVADEKAKEEVRNLLKANGVDETQVSYWTTASSPTRWYRDVGAIFLRSNKGNLKVVDFKFNSYGESESSSVEAKQK
jgi:agmatine deiminase